MRGSIFLALIATCTAKVKKFTIDLDLPPQKRWLEVAQFYKNEVPPMLATWEMTMDAHIGKDGVDRWYDAAKLDSDHFNEEYLGELQGFVDFFQNPHVTLKALVLWNLMYEMNHPTFCSGLLVATKTGRVVHGRNMDYIFPFVVKGHIDNWPQVTFEAIWRKDGKPLMTSVSWPGHIGHHTAMRYGGWSFEQNTRAVDNHQLANLVAARTGAVGFMLAIRKIMERIPDFEDAVEVIKRTQFMAPHYFILAGARPYQGSVLAINRVGPNIAPGHPVTLSDERWHILQTNDDDESRVAFDLRRPIAEGLLALEQQPEDSAAPGLTVRQMRAPGLYNPATVFTWIANPSTGYHATFLASDFSALPPKRSKDARLALPHPRSKET